MRLPPLYRSVPSSSASHETSPDRLRLQNVIQVWVTSNIVERKDRRNQQRWKIYSAVVTAVLGPGVRTDKYRKGERVVSWKRVLWGTVLPFALLCWSTSAALLCQQYSARYHGGGGVSLGEARLDSSIRPLSTASLASLSDLNSTADVRIMVLVTSSWTNRSLTNRHTFRETSVRLFPRSSPSFSVSYRFLLGAAPSPQTAARAGPGIEAESNEFGDMLVVPAHDDYEHLSQKIYEGWKWASQLDVDYVFKTDDDILLRMDVLAKEFVQLGRRREYWKGFAYWFVSFLPLSLPSLLNSSVIAGTSPLSRTPRTRTPTSPTTSRPSLLTPPALSTSSRKISSISSPLLSPPASSSRTKTRT